MGIEIDIIFVCAFYLELAPEWKTTFTRKDREPYRFCHLRGKYLTTLENQWDATASHASDSPSLVLH